MHLPRYANWPFLIHLFENFNTISAEIMCLTARSLLVLGVFTNIILFLVHNHNFHIHECPGIP